MTRADILGRSQISRDLKVRVPGILLQTAHKNADSMRESDATGLCPSAAGAIASET